MSTFDTIKYEVDGHTATITLNRPEALNALSPHMITELRDYKAAIRETGALLWMLHACENDRGAPGGGLVPWDDIASSSFLAVTAARPAGWPRRRRDRSR